jgi:hypothetical protein
MNEKFKYYLIKLPDWGDHKTLVNRVFLYKRRVNPGEGDSKGLTYWSFDSTWVTTETMWHQLSDAQVTELTEDEANDFVKLESIK